MSLKRREMHEVSATIALAFCPEMLLELWLREAEPRRRPRSICLRGKKQSLNCQDSWNFQGRLLESSRQSRDSGYLKRSPWNLWPYTKLLCANWTYWSVTESSYYKAVSCGKSQCWTPEGFWSARLDWTWWIHWTFKWNLRNTRH